ncbi:MAG TPA: NAD(P)/FAD-dependent oxidoreductase [Gemmatimonadaceae bacterium]|nr:NAD(P)/FAD-dependent oxidoreductase [Gemmatimonadaceae bacterium]
MTTTSSPDASDTVVVVGAGIAGLVCAIELEAAGRRVVVLEREADVGGRARTRVVDGYVIDRGFQVYFTAYPTLGGYLDIPALVLRRFPPAARIAGIADGRPASLIGDAIQDPALLPGTLLARGVSLADKLRLLALRRLATSLTVDECFAPRYSGTSTRDFLRGRGLSAAVVARFFAPFYGGILLDRSLGASASVLLFTFKMLAEGRAALPARGIGAIAAQLAARLRPGTVRTSAPVARVEADGDGGVRGVVLESGERVDAAHVVLACEAPASAALAATAGAPRLAVPDGALPCTTLYFAAAAAPPLVGAALWLNAAAGVGEPDGPVVSHAVTLTEVAPEYALPRQAAAGRHLLAASVVGEPALALDDAALERRARDDLARMRGAPLPPDVALVGVVRVPYAQFPQPPHFREHRPSIAAGRRGLWLAGEALHSSSLEGAARGGRDAARALLSAAPAAASGR